MIETGSETGREPGNEPGDRPPRRRHGRLRRFVVRPFFWLLAVLAVLVLAVTLFLRSDFLRQRALALIVAQLRESTGRAVTAGEVSFTLIPLAVEVQDLTIPGRDPADPPLASVARLRVEAEWDGLRSSVLRINEIVAERPQINLQIYPDGSTNLPDFAGGGGARRGLEVRVDALLLHAGRFRLNAQEIPLELVANQVHARLVRAKRGSLRGDALVERVALTLPHAHTIPVAVSGSILLGAGGIEIESGRVRAPGLTATASGAVGWGAANRGELRFVADGSTAVLEQLGYIAGQVSADPLHAEGSVWWGPPQGSAHGAVVAAAAAGGWGVAGVVTAPSAVLIGRHVEDLEASATVNEAGVDIALKRAKYHGGAVTGSMTIGFGGDDYPSDLRLAVTGAEAGPVLLEQHVPFDGVAAKATGDFAYRFTFTDGARGSGSAHAHLEPAPPGPRQVAMGGEVALRIEQGLLTIETLDLSSPAHHLLGGGTFDMARGTGAFDFDVDTQSVGDLAPLVPVSTPQLWLPTAGRGTLGAHLALADDGVSTALRFNLRDAVAPGLAADQVHGDLVLGARAVENLRLEASRSGGTLTVAGRVPTVEPTPGDPAAIDLRIDAHGWPLAQARPWLPPQVADLQLDGNFSGSVGLSGPLAELSGEIEGGLTEARLGGVELGQVHATLRFDPATLRVPTLVVALPAGDVQAEGTLRFADQGLDFRLHAPALQLASPPFADFAAHLAGNVEVQASVGGTVEHPALAAKVLGHDLAVLEHEIADRGSSLLDVDWRDERLSVRGSLLGLLDVDGGGALSREQADLSLAVRGEALPSLVAALTGSAFEDLTGGFAGRLDVRGALSGTRPPTAAPSGAPALSVALQLTDLHAKYRGLALVNREPVRARLQGGRLLVDSLWIGEVGSDADAVLAGSLGFAAGDALDLKFQSSLPGRWVSLFAPAVQMTGGFDLLATLRGTRAKPVWNGQGDVHDARIILLGFPHAIEEITATLALEPSRLVIDTLSAKLGGGQILGGGTVNLPGGDTAGDYRFQLLAKRVQLRYPEGFVVRGDAELALAPSETGRVIRGVVDLDRIYYLEDLQLGPAQLLRRLLQKQRIEVGETDEFLSSTQLNITVRAPGAVRVRNNIANLHGAADLSLRGTLAAPVVFGRLEIDAGGTVRYGDNDYQIDRAVVMFTNPYRIEPVFDIVARTTIDAYKVSLSLSGTLDRLKPVFSSDPPIPDNEILGLLATGQTTAGTTAQTTIDAPSTGAEAFLYGQAASLVGQRVGTLFGLDSFRVEPLTGAGSTLSSVRLTVGKRLRKDLYVTYSVDPSGTQEQIFKVQWQVRPELALILTQNGDGSYSLDTRWEKSY